MPSKECKHATCSGDHCRREKKPKAKYSKPKRYSKKRAKINREYAEKAKAFREQHPRCEIQAPGCTGETQGVNHKKGKATTELLMDERYWEGACNWCNSWIEANSEWAYEHGHRISKFTI